MRYLGGALEIRKNTAGLLRMIGSTYSRSSSSHIDFFNASYSSGIYIVMTVPHLPQTQKLVYTCYVLINCKILHAICEKFEI